MVNTVLLRKLLRDLFGRKGALLALVVMSISNGRPHASSTRWPRCPTSARRAAACT